MEFEFNRALQNVQEEFAELAVIVFPAAMFLFEEVVTKRALSGKNHSLKRHFPTTNP